MAKATASRDLIRYITCQATRLTGGITKIRLMKFLYLADVYLFRIAGERATNYEWRFYHYGPWALAAQQDIDDSEQAGEIQAERRPRGDEVGEMTLYSSPGTPPEIDRPFGLRFETQLSDAIRTWTRRPLNEFLDYVYFETPPMRDARRGEYLRFEKRLFAEEPTPATRPLPRYSSREAKNAWRAFVENANRDRSRVSVPRDAIADDAFRAALERLDAEDFVPKPLDARVDVSPDDLA